MRVSAFNLRLGVSLAIAAAASACSRESASRRSARADSAQPDTAVAMQAPIRPTTRGASLVGLAYDTLPSPVAFVSGAVIPGSASSPSFDFARVNTPGGDRLLLETAGPHLHGRATRLVVADIALPPIAADERLVMASCDVDGKLDPRVVAIVKSEPKATRLAKVRQAWRADLDARRLDIIPVDGVVCEEPDSGV